uniref:40S ribosomal protein S3 n=1 Tax=Parascaris equorum TaxID=6256 RepID=A0A914R9K7_PAREQ
MAAAQQITKKRKAVQDGVFKAELNNFLMKELAEDGYSGVERGRRIRELTSVVQKRFGFAEGSVELYAEKVSNRGLCAVAQCESLRYKLVGGLAVRRACYGVLRFIMESSAQGSHRMLSGVLGIKVKIMLPHDPKGQMGPRGALPDQIHIQEPNDAPNPTQPYSEHRQEKKDLLPPVPGQGPPMAAY